ncbi:auxin-responsive protein IAA2-like isoform X2 [Brassica napus]|uniref:auxin-responsive protein IAA2-like isoform X2 n=1 Tax=Brassica napus TaxID=3708 RepID=UPI000BBE933A|nr:auxin-responsive protein IAA2-like isoform X2 [Brassica napus]XP_048635187.1 auxin-responsive protein IAA2-like isoform X2 [Brassica napus]
MGGHSVCVLPLSPCLILAFDAPDNFYLSSFKPNFYASSPTFIYLSPISSKSIINQTHQQEQYQEQEQEQEKDSANLDCEKKMAYEKVNELNLKDTELRLGLPGTGQVKEEKEVSCVRSNKRQHQSDNEEESTPPTKTQIVGWPPVRSYRKNNNSVVSYVKVSMDGAPYLRKIDLKTYKNYSELLKELENMFKFTIGEYSEREGYRGSGVVPTYEDKDGDWMLVGDVPWDMFSSSCKRLRIMKGSDALALDSAL